MSKRFNKNLNTASFIAAIALFCLSKPYFFWHGVLGSIWITFLMTLIVGFLFFKHRYIRSIKEVALVLLWGMIIIAYPIINKYSISVFILYIPLLFIPFSTKYFTNKVYNHFLSIYTSILGVSLLIYILSLVGLIHPYTTILPLNSVKSGYYNVYPLLVSFSNNFRFFGPFDEPGVVGTLSGMLICLEKLNFRSKRVWILFLTGVFSLSFFFYLLVGSYMLIDFAIKQRSLKKTIILLIGALMISAIIVRIPILNEILGARFTWDSETMRFMGDNRGAKIAESYLEIMKGTPQYWWGYNNKKEFIAAAEGSSTYLNVIVLNGIVFFVLYVSFFVLYGLKYKVSYISFLLFIFLFCANIYQRPDIFSIIYIFLYCCLAKSND